MTSKNEEKPICGKCLILLRSAYKVTEKGRREKVTCDHCGKRRYGCLCRIERKE